MKGPSLLLTALVATLTGCFADPTEVVVVVDTDATPTQDFGRIQIDVTTPFTGFGGGSSSPVMATPTPLPATVGVVPQGSSTSFGVNVSLFTTQFASPMDQPFVTRKVSNIPFVSGKMKVLFIPVLKKCACVGTNCVHALEPDCKDVTAPALGDFDDGNIPHLPR